MPILKLRCFHCSCLMLVVFGDEPLAIERRCPHCGVLNSFAASHVEPTLATGHFCWACPERTEVIGVA